MSNVVQDFMVKANVAAAYDPNDPLTPIYANLIALYANKTVFANNPSRDNATLIEGCLRAKKILYWKNTPGDCASATKISPSALQTGAKSGLLAAGTLTSLASAGVFGGTAGATGILAETSAVAVSGAFAAATAGIGLALVPVFAIIAHHKAAVAKEQGSICEATGFLNEGFAAIVAANVDWKTKESYFKQITTQALGVTATVTQGSKDAKTCNAGCMIGNAMMALRDLFILLYAQAPAPAPVLDNPIAAIFGSGPTPVNSQGGAVPAAIAGPGGLVVAGGAALAAHFAGVF